MLVTKLSAVSNAESGETLPKCCGFKGSHACVRWIAYVASAPIALNSTSASAYASQVICWPGSMPHAL